MVSELEFAPPALIQGVIRGRAGPRDRADIYVDVCLLIYSFNKIVEAFFVFKEEITMNMKKQFTTILLAATMLGGATVYVATPVQPERYQLHVVSYGETMESIVKDSNRNATSDYDVRDAIATAVAESAKMEGGATSRQLKIGDKVAVPIYR